MIGTNLKHIFEYSAGFYGHFGVGPLKFGPSSEIGNHPVHEDTKHTTVFDRSLSVGRDGLLVWLDLRPGALSVPAASCQLGLVFRPKKREVGTIRVCQEATKNHRGHSRKANSNHPAGGQPSPSS